MNEAMLYETRAENKVRCNLFNHQFRTRDSKRGIRGVRANREGTLYTLVYGKVMAVHIDPIKNILDSYSIIYCDSSQWRQLSGIKQ